MENEKVALYRYETIKGWDALYSFYIKNFTDKKNEWVFRGDNPDPTNTDTSGMPANAFKSRLEKAFDDFEVTDRNICRKIERKLIREFRRKAPLHTNYRQENWLECLGLMQHYEAPTRMLDWTYSFFAAVYFAINRAEEKNCVVWALDSKWFSQKNEEFKDQFIKNAPDKDKDTLRKLRDDGRGGFENAIIHSWMPEPEEKQQTSSEKKEDPIVYAMNPYYLNERLYVQRGVLICPSNVDISWGENLASMLRKESDGEKHLWRVRIEWETVETQKEFLRRLYDMNISQASLFPDLDGLAKSLRTRVAMPETLGIFE